MDAEDLVSFEIGKCGPIETVHQFIESIAPLHAGKEGANHKLWYRGHANTNYKLIPTIGREERYADRKMLFLNKESALLHRFRRRAYPYLGRRITAGEAIFIARHHGLPTRLLDWTANALYALYFACINGESLAGRVWALRRHSGPETDDLDAFDLAVQETESELFDYLNGPTDRSEEPADIIKMVYPLYNTSRLVAQDGAFTVHSHPEKSIESYATIPFKRSNLDIERLYYWEIPCNLKSKLIRELSGLGVTHRTLFPDLDGVAKSVWETEILWNGEPT